MAKKTGNKILDSINESHKRKSKKIDHRARKRAKASDGKKKG